MKETPQMAFPVTSSSDAWADDGFANLSQEGGNKDRFDVEETTRSFEPCCAP